MSACIFPGKESRSCCLSPGQSCWSWAASLHTGHCSALTPQPRSATAVLPQTTARLETGRKTLGHETLCQEHGFQDMEDFASVLWFDWWPVFTKGPLSFISCIPVKTELQCWLFFSVPFTAVISHSAGKYLFPWVKMPKTCKSDFQTVFKIAMFYHCKSLS